MDKSQTDREIARIIEPYWVIVLTLPFAVLFVYFLFATYQQPPDLTCYEEPMYCDSNF